MSNIRYRLVSDVVATSLGDDETVLLNVETRHYYSLNETGTRIWQLLAEGESLDEIAASLTNEYDVSAEDARRHVEAHVAELLAEGLIEEMPDPR